MFLLLMFLYSWPEFNQTLHVKTLNISMNKSLNVIKNRWYNYGFSTFCSPWRAHTWCHLNESSLSRNIFVSSLHDLFTPWFEKINVTKKKPIECRIHLKWQHFGVQHCKNVNLKSETKKNRGEWKQERKKKT